MTQTEAKQYFMLATHPQLIGEQLFVTFAKSRTSALDSVNRMLQRIPGDGPINENNKDQFKVRVVGMQTKESFLSLSEKIGKISSENVDE